MSIKPPVVKGRDRVRVLERAGWTVLRQKGSHVRMEREGRHLSIPMHDALKRGLLAQILEDAGDRRRSPSADLKHKKSRIGFC